MRQVRSLGRARRAKVRAETLAGLSGPYRRQLFEILGFVPRSPISRYCDRGRPVNVHECGDRTRQNKQTEKPAGEIDEPRLQAPGCHRLKKGSKGEEELGASPRMGAAGQVPGCEPRSQGVLAVRTTRVLLLPRSRQRGAEPRSRVRGSPFTAWIWTSERASGVRSCSAGIPSDPQLRRIRRPGGGALRGVCAVFRERAAPARPPRVRNQTKRK